MKSLVRVVGIIFLGTILLTGCNSKKEEAAEKKSTDKVLSCSNIEEQTGMKNKIDMTVEFKNDTAYKMNMDMTVDLDDSYQSYMEQIETSLKEQFSKFEELGIQVNTKIKENQILVNIHTNFEKLTKEEKESLGFSNSDNSYKAVKKSIQDVGYTCK